MYLELETIPIHAPVAGPIPARDLETIALACRARLAGVTRSWVVILMHLLEDLTIKIDGYIVSSAGLNTAAKMVQNADIPKDVTSLITTVSSNDAAPVWTDDIFKLQANLVPCFHTQACRSPYASSVSAFQ